MWGGHCPPAPSPTVTGCLQLPGGNGKGNTRTTVVVSPALVMPKGNLPGGETAPFMFRSAHGGMVEPSLHCHAARKQDSNFLFPLSPTKERALVISALIYLPSFCWQNLLFPTKLKRPGHHLQGHGFHCWHGSLMPIASARGDRQDLQADRYY